MPVPNTSLSEVMFAIHTSGISFLSIASIGLRVVILDVRFGDSLAQICLVKHVEKGFDAYVVAPLELLYVVFIVWRWQ